MREKTKRCRYCKSDIPKKAKYCPVCGKKSKKEKSLIIAAAAVVLVIFFAAVGEDADSSTGSGSDRTFTSGEYTSDHSPGTESDQSGQIHDVIEDTQVTEDTQQEISKQEDDSQVDSEAQIGRLSIGNEIVLENFTEFSEGLAMVEFADIDLRKGSVNAAVEMWEAAMAGDDGLRKYAENNYNPNGSRRCALIDNSGNLVWMSPLTWKSPVFFNCSEFVDGLCCFMFNSNSGYIWTVLNRDGEAVFARTNSEDFNMLGLGGGYALMAEHTSNFSEDLWKIGAIGSDGQLISPFTEYLAPPPDGFGMQPLDLNFDTFSFGQTEYMGQGIFKLVNAGNMYLIDIMAQKVIYTQSNISSGHIVAFLSDFENGSAAILYDDDDYVDRDGVFRSVKTVSTIDTNGDITIGQTNDWIQFCTNERISYQGGSCFYANNGYDGYYADYYGNAVVTIPEYSGKYRYMGDPFQNGYAVVLVYGADNLPYFTVIDQTGKVQFEPITGYDWAFLSEDGKYITMGKAGEVLVLDVKGEQIVKVNYRLINASFPEAYIVRNQILFLGDFYLNVETKQVIGLRKESDLNFKIAH